MRERLQKILSASGVCSRRKAEELISQGLVTVNGRRAQVGDSADPEKDAIALRGKPLGQKPPSLYIMLHKPRGYVTTLQDEKGRKTVMDLLRGVPGRVYPVGRLDMDSEGLLLLTNDGDLTLQLTHPSHEVGKEYLLEMDTPEEDPVEGLTQPMCLDGRPLAPVQAKKVKEEQGRTFLLLTIHEGRNRQIRRMCQQRGYRLRRLKRVAMGRLRLGELPPGRWRALTGEEVAYLKNLSIRKG